MAIDLQVTIDALRDSTMAALGDLLQGATADVQAELQGEALRISQRTAELATMALQGDDLAAQTLEDMRAQALTEWAITTMREQDRLAATMRLIAAQAIKILLGVAAAA